jgi:dTDP-3-amino-2,3,6-trideoxy-4-keto-D-glucose/dTDP-3-amino-3,4,6-trideoxy-alpha-D-glucose/dTDP-2,6-dideoxy-D-kanosamine transaminase
VGSDPTVKVLLINEIRRQNAVLAAEINAAVARVLQRGWYILGPEVEAFEHEFATYCGVAHCVGVANGTDALELALRALDLPPGSRVLTVANAGMYASTAILAAGHVPVYTDVDPVSMTMRGDGSGAQAVMATHLYGRMVAMKSIGGQVPVIEDCAQAHGAVLDGKRAGSCGTLGCFSFYPTKNLGALGDGGAVTTNDAGLAARVKQLRQYGWSSKYRSEVSGGRNSRLDELQAAILRAKLPRLNEWNERRREIARRYNTSFSNTGLCTPQIDESYVAHLYVVRSDARDRIRQALSARGIATDVHYPIPDYAQPSLRAAMPLPVTEQCCRTVLTLPCFPEMTDSEIGEVIDAVLSV